MMGIAIIAEQFEEEIDELMRQIDEEEQKVQ